ncbi:MAG TPA: glycoside hydrolase N-terminal domain-containing protein [Chitinophagaceae bacterium]|nr:glycoside hydrolase N-terminal domain-containing protein [Chitinophagaceae bacterium]
MVKFLNLVLVVLLSSFGSLYSQISDIPALIANKKFDPSTLLWYQSPASVWEDALPVGNGRLGAMVFGKYDEETIQLNDDTYWTGGPYSTVVKGGYEKLPEIQKDVFEGRPIEAHKLFGRYLMGYPVEQQKYQALANLVLTFDTGRKITDYKRWLDLKTGITGVQYKAGGVTYQREIFSSAPDQTIAVRITADKPGSISFTAELRGIRNGSMSNYATDYFRMDGVGNDGLKLTGKSADYMGIKGQLRYEARLKAVAEGGRISVNDADLIVENADAVTLYFVDATNFVNYKDVSGDYQGKVQNYLKNIESKTYNGIKDAAVKDYQSLFDRVSLTLPATGNSFLPTDERIKLFSKESDPQLASLSYQFGRYVLISSSRPGTQPANLQGIWNNNMNPPWDSKYTTNINTEMNYWPVESGNLSELAKPLIQMVKDLTDQGSEVAKEHYGARGWVCHQNTDIWRVAAPMDGPTWGTFTVGGAWLTTQLWEHYSFTLDTAYLRDVYPVMKGAVQFFMDFLVEYPKNKKWLITCPSTSPENPPKGPGYHYFFDEVTAMYYFTTICAGSSIDMQIISDLFEEYIKASKILNVDQDFADSVAIARSRLVPPQIGSDGMLQEWAEDYEQLEPKHRHISLLYGLYPGNVISVKKTPLLIGPVKKVLEERGDGGAGFSRAWKISIWARLYDGNRAYKIFKGYINDQCFPQLFAKCFTPMQVDGTLGVTAGITEMLIQSHEGVIDLLPALPKEWSDGEFDGVCARGAFEVNLQWKNYKITKAVILSKKGGTCVMDPKLPVVVKCNGRKVKIKNVGNGVIEFQTKAGAYYTITPK